MNGTSFDATFRPRSDLGCLGGTVPYDDLLDEADEVEAADGILTFRDEAGELLVRLEEATASSR